MEKVLVVDDWVRKLNEEGNINLERSVQIQKNVNVLFLNLFKSWVQSDTIAKKFLMELNGFDFLLNRLFTQKEEDTGLTTDEGDLVKQNSSDEEESEMEEEELFEGIKKKIFT